MSKYHFYIIASLEFLILASLNIGFISVIWWFLSLISFSISFFCIWKKKDLDL